MKPTSKKVKKPKQSQLKVVSTPESDRLLTRLPVMPGWVLLSPDGEKYTVESIGFKDGERHVSLVSDSDGAVCSWIRYPPSALNDWGILSMGMMRR